MNIVIGSYKFRLEIVVILVIVFWIMMGHLLCSCCLFNLREGLEMAQDVSKDISNTITQKLEEKENKLESEENNGIPKPNKTKEGFMTAYGGSKALYDPQFANSKSPGYIMPPNTWSQQTLTYNLGKTQDKGVQEILNRPKQQIPLPEGQLDFLSTTPFKPECCPNLYSNSSGCACINVDQYNYIQMRGGNNVPYDIY